MRILQPQGTTMVSLLLVVAVFGHTACSELDDGPPKDRKPLHVDLASAQPQEAYAASTALALDADVSWVCSYLAPQTCRFAQRCGPDLAASLAFSSDCEEEIQVCLLGLQSLQPSIRSGKIEINSEAVSRCEAWLSAIPCDFDWTSEVGFSSECREIFVGRVRRGGRCSMDLECAGGLDCSNGVCGWVDASVRGVGPRPRFEGSGTFFLSLRLSKPIGGR